MKNYPMDISNKKEYKSWEKSEKSKDKSKTMRVEEIENGFIVIIDTTDSSKDKYEYDCKKWYSKTNPLEKETPLDSNEDGLMKAIDKFNESF